jgi:hypothetical protein
LSPFFRLSAAAFFTAAFLLYFIFSALSNIPSRIKINAEEFYREGTGNDFLPINFIYLHPLRGSREKDVKKFISQNRRKFAKKEQNLRLPGIYN